MDTLVSLGITAATAWSPASMLGAEEVVRDGFYRELDLPWVPDLLADQFLAHRPRRTALIEPAADCSTPRGSDPDTL